MEESKMSNLEELKNTVENPLLLLKEVKNSGVEFRKLGEVAEIYDGTHTTPKYTSSGVKFVSVENINNLYATKKYISEDDYKNYKIKPQIDDVFMTRIGSIGICSVINSNEPLAYYVSLALLRPNHNYIIGKYLKYVIESSIGKKELEKRSLLYAIPPKINKNEIGNIEIPIPPLDIQEEIVRILDPLTKDVNELIDLLKKEQELRKKQYAYYRDKLLTFDENVPRVKLGEIGKISMCKRIMKKETNSISGIPFYKIGTFGGNPDSYISEELFKEYISKYSYPKKGDILISTSGTIGKLVIFDGLPAYFQDSNIVWIDNNEEIALNKYLYHIYKTSPWKITKGGTIARLYNGDIANTKIPLPPIEKQKEIVTILDNLEKYYNNLQESLPSEIEKRKKQYEFYRDKLLTF